MSTELRNWDGIDPINDAGKWLCVTDKNGDKHTGRLIHTYERTTRGKEVLGYVVKPSLRQVVFIFEGGIKMVVNKDD